MLKAYAVAVALSSTAPITTSAEVVAQPIQDNAQTLEVKKNYKRGRALIIPFQETEVQKNYKRGRALIIPN